MGDAFFETKREKREKIFQKKIEKIKKTLTKRKKSYIITKSQAYATAVCD